MAPIAPPSVGVATPRKMVPSTRKISSSGGISTKVTRSARRDKRLSFRPLLISAITSATNTPPHMATTTFSSVATEVTSWPWNQVCTNSMLRASTTATTADSAVMPTSEA